MQVTQITHQNSEYLPDQIHSGQVPTWPTVQNLSECPMPDADSTSEDSGDLQRRINISGRPRKCFEAWPRQLYSNTKARGRVSNEMQLCYSIIEIDYRGY
jgi:hypothetical protein